MTFGLETWVNGIPNITPDGAGGVYLETLTQTRSMALTRTYTGIVGMSLRVFQVGAGGFTWATGVDGSGNPYITFTAIASTYNEQTAILLMFAI